MYGLKIAGTDQVSFGPVPVLMGVKNIWSTDTHSKAITKIDIINSNVHRSEHNLVTKALLLNRHF